MRFRPTAIAGVVEVLADRARDARGAFLRSWCADRFAGAGLDFVPTQASLSENTHRHTLRGMHWQDAPAAEQKLVRCIRGAVFDVALDLRPGGGLRHGAVVLSAEQGNAFFIPRGCAHGFITLTDDAVVEYLIDAPYAPDLARGARWDDPAFAIPWPAAPAVISDRDRDWPPHG
ncbi:dTDP-4-dehydrorhamnose 3,5-epimerase family protein [Falsiroseomonas stagni]|uniref:dTDP-4-dehydrorhamnose 3,5-epimerase n=1 Tax=Falsiroseomonas stagni DSM 19981 TaxID=1123062 RepID=A0A1I4DN87_9PROT|nr:dTDP-4-dehydrorhamnose 3,5-epimerase family protein [Falsiroseomonas stagni]SFK94543.1 dTDP-4-dehydrorhamnose 3,5-epimerase [Falsiroseomonas stagni DSM 19981]